MAETALITGASTGIGAEIARIHAARGGNLVLVARREDRLQSLKSEIQSNHDVKVEIIPVDLSIGNAAAELFAHTLELGIEVDILVNNAGIGGHGRFNERCWADERAMMRLNVEALTQLTHLYLHSMVKRGRGRILNVSSTAGMLPGPMQAVYYATKAYVLSFSQAIAEELSDTGVSVTVLCPGPVRTEFAANANLDGVPAFDRAVSPRGVARCGYDAMLKGKLIAIDRASLSFLLNWVVPLLPRQMVLKMSRRSMEKR